MSRARGRSARPIWSVVVLLGLAGCTGQPRHEAGNLPALVAALDDARPLVRRLAGEALRRIDTD